MGSILSFFTMPHPPIVIPEVGRGEEKKIQNTFDACSKVAEEIGTLKPDTIIIITPHGTMFSDAVSISCEKNIYGNLSNFGITEVNMNLEINTSLVRKIVENAEGHQIPVVALDKETAELYNIQFKLDHGAIVPLYFVNKKFNDYRVVHITYGMLSDIQLYKFGMAIKHAVEESDTNAVFIASGDLSHALKENGLYAYNPYGEKFDNEIIRLLKSGDVLGVFNMDQCMIENAGQCGLRSYHIMLGAMDGYKIKGELLSYEGTFGVGYGVMKFNLQKSNEDMLPKIIEERQKKHKDKLKDEDLYIRLARESLTYYIKNNEYMKVPDYVSEEMKNNKRGVFVSLKKFEKLRGCIGTIFPATNSIAEEIIRNAVEAGETDPRFNPVEEIELNDIDFSVDVLTEPVLSSKDELNPKKYGVIVRSGKKAGLLLPDLEGVHTAEEQLDIALQKAGISSDENYTIEKFEVIRHK